MSPQDHVIWYASISLLVLAAVFMFVSGGWPAFRAFIQKQEDRYDRVLNQQLLLDVPPRLAVGLATAAIIGTALLGYFVVNGLMWLIVGALVGACLPHLAVRHLEQKRLNRLNNQIIDAITTMASGLRAGLNLVQAFELLVRNTTGPVHQEFSQLLREYQMGLDLNHCMRNAANRIGSSHYRLLFTAMEMHRVRGGDAADSLDTLAESIREIQRLEGKLDAVTSQGRTQAWMMGISPFVLLFLLWTVDPEAVEMLFTQGRGRIILLISVALIAAGYFWIRKIMEIDI